MTDERLGQPPATPKARGRSNSRTPAAGRQPRDKAAASRAPRGPSDDERMEMFRGSAHSSLLPNLPPISGYHVCWLTTQTQNPHDGIPSRMRLGYEPVKPGDIQGWEGVSIKTGEYAGCIGVNEMIAFKLPLSLYQRYMREAHHTAPMNEEDKIRAVAEQIQGEAKDRGANVLVGEGTSELGRYVKDQFGSLRE